MGRELNSVDILDIIIFRIGYLKLVIEKFYELWYPGSSSMLHNAFIRCFLRPWSGTLEWDMGFADLMQDRGAERWLMTAKKAEGTGHFRGWCVGLL